MWKYVSRRVKDTIELGINARKAFSLNQLNHNENQPKQQNDDLSSKNLILQLQDPSSRDKHKREEKFKRKYNRLHSNQRCFLNALTWSAALVSGFYTSQLLCLYRRNHRFIAENSRCYYSNYLYNKTQAVHRNISYLLTQAGQQNLIENVKQIATTCPFQSTKAEPKEVVNLVDKKRSIVDEFKDFKHFIDPGFHRYQQFFEPQDKPLNTNNDKNHKETKTSQSTNVDSEYKSENKSHKKSQDEIIDETIIQLAKIVGEIEFELGVQCYRAGKFEEAVNHFKLSSGHKHAGSIFNLALCYEDGLGVKKNMKTARKLYEIASELGHAKATYNLGVYYANGYGGVDKNFKQAKKCFTQAMELGNADAKKAMKLVKPKVKLPVIDEYEEFLYNNNNNINKNLNVMEQPSLVRIAVT